MSLTKLTYQELQELIPIVLKAGEVPFVQGIPGVGKSTFWREIAEKFDLKFIDIRLTTFDPTMFNGFLWIKDDKAGFKTLDVFPIEGDSIPINIKTGKPYKGFLIHLDEFTQPPKSVEGAAYQLVLDRQVGDKKLHPKTFIVCSGNPQGQGMIAKSLSTPMRSRVIHFCLENSAKTFIDTAIDKLDFHSLIPMYLKANPDMMNNFNTNAMNADGTYACERTWQKLSNILKILTVSNVITYKHLPLLVGTVGEVAGNSFYAFTQSYYACPNISLICANPKSTPIPELIIDQYAALAYLVENTNLNNGNQVAVYISRFNEEFQLIFGKILLKKKEKVFDTHFMFLTALVTKYAI